MSDLKLFFVAASCPAEDFSEDLIVTARDRTEAVELWLNYYGYTEDEIDLEDHKVRVAEIPKAADEPKAHLWHKEIVLQAVHNRSTED